METSEKIKAFLDFVDECRTLNEMARNGISEEEKRQQDLLHAIEFESNGRKRSPIDTKLHKCRLSRRRYKDIFEETDVLYSSSKTRLTKEHWSSYDNYSGR